ncbi:hypothetical protein HAX54_050442 [Datura stramonium]|uniref:Uncharacterized protein n=1 Tax=Datura stramonium TaxID=4076 RepID=A0ABS8WQ94_DATST|nr:hypothetical protein [Datura stramonium]
MGITPEVVMVEDDVNEDEDNNSSTGCSKAPSDVWEHTSMMVQEYLEGHSMVGCGWNQQTLTLVGYGKYSYRSGSLIDGTTFQELVWSRREARVEGHDLEN